MLGTARLRDSGFWDLRLGAITRARAEELLRDWAGKNRFIACGLGTKVEVKDWGVKKWKTLLGLLGTRYPGYGLLLVGSAEESGSSRDAANAWLGPVLNVCGITSPRETAALMERATVFLGHDSGPMHLAATMGTICIAVFAARNLPRVWFPYGQGHRPIYHQTSCAGCGLEHCSRFNKMCIESITVDEVYAAVAHTLNHLCEARSAQQAAV
jgi:ADP-heptose:LPS heptosyltransferase